MTLLVYYARWIKSKLNSLFLSFFFVSSSLSLLSSSSPSNEREDRDFLHLFHLLASLYYIFSFSFFLSLSCFLFCLNTRVQIRDQQLLLIFDPWYRILRQFKKKSVILLNIGFDLRFFRLLWVCLRLLETGFRRICLDQPSFPPLG